MSEQTPLSDPLPWIEGFEPRNLPSTRIHVPEQFEVRDVRGEYPPGTIPRPETQVASSWLRQISVLNEAGVRIRMQARLEQPARGGVTGDQFADRPAPEWPLAEPLLILGVVPGPSVVYANEAAASQEELIRQLHLHNVPARAATTVDRSHLWAEPCVIAHPNTEDPLGSWRETTMDIAVQMGIETIVDLTHGMWTVLTVTTSPTQQFTATTSVPASITQDVEHRCPMQTAPRQGEYCQMRGGPWTSASITAAGYWRDQRDLLVAALGCDTCEGKRYLFQGKVHTSGGPISIVPSPLPTRWPRADDADRRQRNARA